MSNLNQIINSGAVADNSIIKRTSVNTRICTYLNIITYDYSAELRNAMMLTINQLKAEIKALELVKSYCEKREDMPNSK